MKRRSNATKISIALILLLVASLIPMTAFAHQHEETEDLEALMEEQMEAAAEEEAEEKADEIIEEEEVDTTVVFTVNSMVYIAGGEMTTSDVAPYILFDRIMVPVAHVSRALGAEVAWDGETRTVTVTKDDDIVTMVIGEMQMTVNGVVEEMDSAAVIQDIGDGLGRTMLPVSRLARVLDVDYVWDEVTQSVTFMPVVEEEVAVFVYDEAGTYGPEEGTETIEGDVHVKAEDVVLQNRVITGDLIIAEEVGEGDVTLNNIQLEGTMYVRGGGEDSIYINGGSIKNIIIEATSSGSVRIVVTDAEGVNVTASELAANRTIILEGDFESVTIDAPNVTIETRGETTINQMTVTEKAENTIITLSKETTINTLTNNSTTTEVEGEGRIAEQDGDEDADLGDDVQTGEEPVSRPIGGGGGGGSTTTYYAPTVSDVKFGDADISQEGNTFTVTVVEGNRYAVDIVGQLDYESEVTVTSNPLGFKLVDETFTKGEVRINVKELLDKVGVSDESVLGSTLINFSADPGVEIVLTNADAGAKKTTYYVKFREEI